MADRELIDALLRTADPIPNPAEPPSGAWGADVALLEIVRRSETMQAPDRTITPEPTRPPARRSRRGVLVAAVAFVIALVVLGVGSLLFGGEDEVVVDEAPTTTAAPTTTLPLETTAAPATTASPTTAPPTTTTEATTTTLAAPVFDGRIAIEMDNGTGGFTNIYIADTTRAQLGSSIFSRQPDWAPDGSYVVFGGNWDEEFGFELIRLDVVTGEVELIEDEPSYSFAPRVSPDGTLIAYRTLEDDGSTAIDLRIMTAAGELVATLDVQGNSHAWSPDGTQIALGRGVELGGGLVSVDLDGTVEPLVEGLEFGATLWWSEHGIVATVRELGASGNFTIAIIEPATGDVSVIEENWDYATWGPDGDLLLVDRSSGDIFGRRPNGEVYGPVVDGPYRAFHISWVSQQP